MVIPVLNEAARIASAIESTVGVGQVIVVDGGSTDQTVEIASSYDHVLVIHSQRGRGCQMAAGANLCQRSVLLFLHGDCQLSADACSSIIAAINAGQLWGALRQRIDASGIRYRFLEYGNSLRVKCFGMVFGDQAMFMLTETYRASGGFEAILLMEDIRISRRLRKLCWPVLLRSQVIVDARRWRRRGVARQTILNWKLQILHLFGMSPDQLERRYR